jgi:uncharacterized membrane protein
MTILLILALFLWLVLGPVEQISTLRKRIEVLETQLRALRNGAPTQVTPVSTALVQAPLPATPAATPSAERAGAAPRAHPQPAMTQQPSPRPASGGGFEKTIEAFGRWLIERWAIAAGGVTASLGGLFIVRYSIEQGLLGPGARVILAALLGFVLIAAAEWARRRPGDETTTAMRAHVSAALSAAGLVTLYGDIYAAYAFYQFLTPTLTFLLLAAVSFGTLAAGLAYGPLAAALGTGMGLLAPALVASERPDAGVLFPYLFIVSAGIFALLRYRPWPWLAALGLGGNAVWQLIWMISVGGGQPVVRVLHLLAIPMLSVLLLLREPWTGPNAPWWQWDWSKAPLPVRTVSGTVLGSFGLLWLLAAGTGFGGPAAIGWGVGIALLIALARWAPTQQPLLAIVAILTVGLVASWDVPAMVQDGRMPWFLHGPVVPAALAGYVMPATAYAALFGIGGFVGLLTSSQRGLWATVSAATPIVLLALLYARLSHFAPSLPWSGIALALAAVALIATERTVRRGPDFAPASAAYAAAVTAAIALGATMVLRTSWLTVALALELPALAWVHQAIRGRQGAVPGLCRLAEIIAGILFIRLLLNPYVGLYSEDMPILWNWLLYGYGVPCLAAWVAARWFGSDPDAAQTQTVLQAAALAFGTALVTLQLWHAASGRGHLFTADNLFSQVAAVGAGWLVLGYLLLQRDRTRPNKVLFWGARIIGGAGLVWSVLLTLVQENPAWTDVTVGATPVFNLLLLGYGLPALLCALGAIELRRQGQHNYARIVSALCIVFATAAILLEIRQAFQGTALNLGSVGEAESYSYSVGLLIVSLGLLAGSLRWPASDLRVAGSALLAVTLGKAFLVDMDDLTGLWRAASFLGLGLSLIGVGYAFQRLRRLATPGAPPG